MGNQPLELSQTRITKKRLVKNEQNRPIKVSLG